MASSTGGRKRKRGRKVVLSLGNARKLKKTLRMGECPQPTSQQAGQGIRQGSGVGFELAPSTWGRRGNS